MWTTNSPRLTGVNMKERAFPWCGDLNDCPTINLGMTLRDYFAAKAMQGMFASGNLPQSVQDDELAFAAYEMADAMLKARGE
jgi:hypothetical protein